MCIMRWGVKTDLREAAHCKGRAACSMPGYGSKNGVLEGPPLGGVMSPRAGATLAGTWFRRRPRVAAAFHCLPGRKSCSVYEPRQHVLPSARILPTPTWLRGSACRMIPLLTCRYSRPLAPAAHRPHHGRRATTPKRVRHRTKPSLQAQKHAKVAVALQKKDKGFRRYAAGVDRALAVWDTAQQEWADYISFLGRLLKVTMSPKFSGGCVLIRRVGPAVAPARDARYPP